MRIALVVLALVCVVVACRAWHNLAQLDAEQDALKDTVRLVTDQRDALREGASFEQLQALDDIYWAWFDGQYGKAKMEGGGIITTADKILASRGVMVKDGEFVEVTGSWSTISEPLEPLIFTGDSP